MSIARLSFATAALALAAAPAAPARACGGLFCSSANPVNQAAERIVFSFDRAQKQVTAVVEIQYQGPSEKFAWVLPVRGVPQVGVSTSALLDRLQAVTNPTYSIQRSWGDRCNSGGTGGNGGSFGLPPPAVAPGQGGASNPNVMVLASGSVGPYNYDVIKIEPANSDPAEVAIQWLKTNGYDVGQLGPDVLRPYLRDGLNLIAFRLQKNREAGAIRPVMLTYTDDQPMIPIRPTAVAANDDMGILVWVLSAGRAVPTNFKTLEINEAVLDWFNPNMVYNDVVNAAADQAGGQGFVTELATSMPASIGNSIYPEASQVDQFRRSADGLAPAELVVQLVQSFSVFSGGGGFGGPFAPGTGGQVALDGVADVLAKHLHLPAGVKVEDVLASPRCYFKNYRMQGAFYCDGKPLPPEIDLTGFDRIQFLTDVEALVIGPMEKTVALFRAQRYLTRLYTTMSPRDMTLDPEFDINSSLKDVSNAHSLALKYLDTCFGDPSGRWEATLESGHKVLGRDSQWPYTVKSPRMPANLRVTQLGVSGAGAIVQDNSAMISGLLAAAAPPPEKSGSSGCSLGGGSVGSGLIVLAGAALALVSRRRRRITASSAAGR
jgi:hypothetical protein